MKYVFNKIKLFYDIPAPVGGISARMELHISLYGVARAGIALSRYLQK